VKQRHRGGEGWVFFSERKFFQWKKVLNLEGKRKKKKRKGGFKKQKHPVGKKFAPGERKA